MQPSPPPFRVRSLTSSVYLPNFLYAVGQGAVTPMVALLALDLGASPAVAGLIVALQGVGLLVFDVPAGILVARFGEKRSMIGATVVTGLIALGIGARPALPVYGALIVLMGCAWSMWTLARLTFATEVSPTGHRGRVMSMIGGMGRIGLLVGPVLGGLLVGTLGLAAPFYLQAVLGLAASVTLALSPQLSERHRPEEQATVGILTVLRENERALRTAGVAVIAVQLLRSARQAVIPLWGTEIGASAEQISFIFAASALIEVLVFYPVGSLMDRRGRKWVALPCIALLSVSMGLVPLTSTVLGLTLVGLFMGFANGLGSGINMTLGSDFSPRLGRSQFLGWWRLVGDLGTAGGPFVVAVVTSAVSLAAASVAVGGLGLAGAAVLWLAVPETLDDTSGRGSGPTRGGD